MGHNWQVLVLVEEVREDLNLPFSQLFCSHTLQLLLVKPVNSFGVLSNLTLWDKVFLVITLLALFTFLVQQSDNLYGLVLSSMPGESCGLGVHDVEVPTVLLPCSILSLVEILLLSRLLLWFHFFYRFVIHGKQFLLPLNVLLLGRSLDHLGMFIQVLVNTFSWLFLVFLYFLLV